NAMMSHTLLAMAGGQQQSEEAAADPQMQLLAAFLQQSQQQTQQAQQQVDVENETANAAIRAVMEAMPQLANVPHIQQQVVQMILQQQAEQQRRQQELEQQRQQGQQHQLAALMGILLHQQPQNNFAFQLALLQQLMGAAQATSPAAPPTQAANSLMQVLAGQVSGAPTPPPPLAQDTSSANNGAADPASLLQMLASAASNQMPPVIRNINEISGTSDISSDRSNKIDGASKKQRIYRPSNVGRPANAFENRDENGRAKSLPSLLVMPNDLLELSAHQTLLRHQIEVFQAGEEDVGTHTRGRNKPVEIGQIGLRCRHCKVLPVAERLRGSVYFPRAIEGFYQASQNMNSTHLQTGECQMMGEDLRQEFSDLITSRGPSTGAGRAYWAEQARNLGLRNSEEGIRFHADEKNVGGKS
ncbi:MAG: hypothetical protein SGARI_004375, partial [Bacillariaceae sp.]